jgi:tRNA1Val (adenine37-N6)-methyltransferase
LRSVASPLPSAASDYSDDVLCGGALSLRQHTGPAAYRFGLDSLLLATDLPAVADDGLVVDLGAGNGVVGLCAALQRRRGRLLLVERQPGLAQLCRLNSAVACVAARVAEADVRVLPSWLASVEAATACLVLCNPPFFAAAGGTETERAAARQELHGSLADFLGAAEAALADSGRAAAKFVVPPARLPELLGGLRSMRCASLRFVHAAPGAEAHLVEVVLRKRDAPHMRVCPPLFVRGEDGRYSEEVARRIASAALDSVARAALTKAELERIRGSCAAPTVKATTSSA